MVQSRETLYILHDIRRAFVTGHEQHGPASLNTAPTTSEQQRRRRNGISRYSSQESRHRLWVASSVDFVCTWNAIQGKEQSYRSRQ